MRATEFIQEMRIGSVTSGGVTPTKHPVARKHAKLAYDIVKSVGNAGSTEEKFNIIYNLKAGNTSNKIVVQSIDGRRFSVKSYNPETGEIKLIGPGAIPYITSMSALEFKGKERTMSSSIKYWIFIANELHKDEEAPMKKRGGRPPKSDASNYSFPTRLW